MQLTTLPSKLNYKWQFEAIGTLWSIETTKPLGRTEQKITERIEKFDQVYSRFRNDSLVLKSSQAAGEYHFPIDAERMVEFYRLLYIATDGSVSPLVGEALSEAGYDKDYSLKPGLITDVPLWDDVMVWTGASMKANRPVLLDFGAAGKGYLVDIVAKILEQYRYDTYVIDAGGDIRVCGTSQNIGMENPYDPGSVIGITNVEHTSLCASATNRRAWDEWHHVVDAKTAKPANDIVATWVITDDTMVADGIATALFFVDPDKLSRWDFEYVRIDTQGHIDKSAGFLGELFV